MATNVPATTFPAPAVTTADGLEDVPDPAEDPVEEAEATEVSVVLAKPVEAGLETPVAVDVAAVVSASSVAAGSVAVGSAAEDSTATESVLVVSAAAVEATVAAALLNEEDACEMVDEAEGELEPELELELELPDASILKGKEYWKVLESESRVIFRPYVAAAPRSLPTVQV